jgi:hypothetical protein
LYNIDVTTPTIVKMAMPAAIQAAASFHETG